MSRPVASEVSTNRQHSSNNKGSRSATGMPNQRSATNRIVATLSTEIPKYGRSLPRMISVRVTGDAMS